MLKLSQVRWEFEEGVWPALAGDREGRRYKQRGILGQGPDCVTSTARYLVAGSVQSGRRLAPKWSFLSHAIVTVKMDVTRCDMTWTWTGQGELFCWNKRASQILRTDIVENYIRHSTNLKSGFWYLQPKTVVINPRPVYVSLWGLHAFFIILCHSL